MYCKLSFNRNQNQISSLPYEIGTLFSLKELNVADNLLSKLPVSIGNLVNLRDLNVSGNNLATIDSFLGKLRNLKMLNCARNRIQDIPSEVGGLRKLENLIISANPVRFIPEEITRLHHLQVLQAEDCLFSREITSIAPMSRPSLRELAARTIVRMRLNLSDVDANLAKYLDSCHKCTLCGGNFY